MGETLEQGRRRFFADHQFPADGGYEDAWAEASFGPLPYAVPNLRIRAEALRVHDLHHVVTGYSADWRGEAQISGWELGSGGAGRFAYAWFIALFGLFTGLLGAPVATWRAFMRGRDSTNLYAAAVRQPPAALLGYPIDRVRRSLHRSRPRRLPDAMAFAAWSAVALLGAAFFVLGSPIAVLAATLRRAPCPMRLLCNARIAAA